MINEFEKTIEKIQELSVAPHIKDPWIQIEDKYFWRSSLARVHMDEESYYLKTIFSNSLQSIPDFIFNNIDGVKPEDMFVHILDHSNVKLFLKADDKKIRSTLVSCSTYPMIQFCFSRWMDPKKMVIELYGKFEWSGDIESVIEKASSIQIVKTNDKNDDYESKSESVHTGNQEKIFSLSPHRTYPEIIQPQSRFIFKTDVKEGNCQLIESDGGHWKIDAHAKIKKWLKEKLPSTFPIIG